jgi:cytochrome c-type biogenesis protein CcmH/NrfG
LAAAQRMIEIAPNNTSSWDALSQVQAKLKNFAEAIKAGEKAVALADDFEKEYYQKKLDRIKEQAAGEKK